MGLPTAGAGVEAGKADHTLLPRWGYTGHPRPQPAAQPAAWVISATHRRAHLGRGSHSPGHWGLSAQDHGVLSRPCPGCAHVPTLTPSEARPLPHVMENQSLLQETSQVY